MNYKFPQKSPLINRVCLCERATPKLSRDEEPQRNKRHFDFAQCMLWRASAERCDFKLIE